MMNYFSDKFFKGLCWQNQIFYMSQSLEKLILRFCLATNLHDAFRDNLRGKDYKCNI